MATQTSQSWHTWELEGVGPMTLAHVLNETEERVARGDIARFRALATGFSPLDEVLNGGIRRGELLIVGGRFGVGKTIFGLQMARNVIYREPDAHAMVICYEHDQIHLMMRLLCLESAEQGKGDDALTLRRLNDMALGPTNGRGLISALRNDPRYAGTMEVVSKYADRLTLVKASGDTSTLDQIRQWAQEAALEKPAKLLVVVDYLQKIPVQAASLRPETEVTTFLAHGLKEMAMGLGVQVVAIAASDRPGLKAPRMRMADLRGSSAIQYEADIGMILNNKHQIVSREHLVYNLARAEGMRNWVVMTIEKNRAGRNTVDMEYTLDAAHFRIVPSGGFVRERLLDEKVTLE